MEYMKHICRICLAECLESQSIFTTYENVYLPKIIHTLTQIVVTEGDEFPSIVCQNCADILVQSEHMRKLCISSDIYLKEQQNENTNRENFDSDDNLPENLSKCSSTLGEIPEVEDRNESPNLTDEFVPELYMCIVCSYKYTTLDAFNEHLNYHFNENVRCPICLEEIELKLIKGHTLNHNDKGELTCPECSNNYVDLPDLFIHIKETHGTNNIPKETSAAKLYKPYIYRCEFCDFETVSLPLYKKHMKQKYGISDRYPYKCYYCIKRFTTKQNLIIHYDNVHNPLGPATNKKHTCPICHKKFYLKVCLKNHLRRHTGEQPYKCNYCPITFTQNSGLNSHERIHSNDEIYLCSICGKIFKHMTHFLYHQNAHLDKRPYPCNKCYRAFRSKSSLYIHKKTHEEKKFRCHLCASKFTMQCFLNQHLKNKHNIKLTIY